MTKRVATRAEIDAAPMLKLRILESEHQSDTISSGGWPELYSVSDLKKVELKGSARTVEFERRLVAIYWTICEPVPFLFRTSDGELRSLDAGCLGYLANRTKPDVGLIESDGVIVQVKPCEALVQRMEPMRSKITGMLKID